MTARAGSTTTGRALTSARSGRPTDFLGRTSVEATDGSPDDEHEMHHVTGETFEGEPHDAAIEQTRDYEGR
ncbi:hypothetical protein [Natrinema sp. DC36]|uniref:hypothetical protein n=1 Tax=Natrinema sp. DC36 TaxID=2878680 RepID=UPI001CEFDF0A|nr:hypothetical protein [Natrinema sp. DC36]